MLGGKAKPKQKWTRFRLAAQRATGWIEVPWNPDRQVFERILPIDGKAWRERLVGSNQTVGEGAVLLYEFASEDGTRRIMKLIDGKYYRAYEWVGWKSGWQ